MPARFVVNLDARNQDSLNCSMYLTSQSVPTNDVQFQFRNWNWNRISRIFRDGGIGIGIELKPKLKESNQYFLGWNWNRNWIEHHWSGIGIESESTFAGIAHHWYQHETFLVLMREIKQKHIKVKYHQLGWIHQNDSICFPQSSLQKIKWEWENKHLFFHLAVKLWKRNIL